MKRDSKALAILFVTVTTVLLTGCGTSSGGGGPVSQPLSDSQTTVTTTAASSNSASSASSTSKSPGSTTSKGTNSTGASTPTQGTGTPVLTAVKVNETGTGNTFVPVSASVSSILLPSGWQLQTASLGSGGTSLKLVNPADSSQMISEVVMPSDRNLQSFYNSQSSSTVHWIVPGQILSYTQSNPDNPYSDRGIMANLSSGGSIRVDVYLPSAEQKAAEQILNSFVGNTTA
ncbi:hypothetical protein [Sulfoacidibacillus thermotolerans]|uniref:Uncharacterized protein n=1 Tax=Sulfoacidibacillus thermotolerans TaxID=1765684 RepID=A0A2U3DCA8_SULT2|nr:hypothetical protein [Sulfoacidibacillus thermotolerans]PWI58923.1 hypothetical protein BM613_02265 [Sulfoacidibacillus thermotolerans]